MAENILEISWVRQIDAITSFNFQRGKDVSWHNIYKIES